MLTYLLIIDLFWQSSKYIKGSWKLRKEFNLSYEFAAFILQVRFPLSLSQFFMRIWLFRLELEFNANYSDVAFSSGNSWYQIALRKWTLIRVYYWNINIIFWEAYSGMIYLLTLTITIKIVLISTFVLVFELEIIILRPMI